LQIAAARSAFSTDHNRPLSTVVARVACVFCAARTTDSCTTCTTSLGSTSPFTSTCWPWEYTTKALRSELKAIGLRPHDTGWVGGSIEVLLGVMHPAGSGGPESPSWRPGPGVIPDPTPSAARPHMGSLDHQIGVQGNGCARLGPAVISSVQSIRSG
jgi:hypothetical protein